MLFWIYTIYYFKKHLYRYNPDGKFFMMEIFADLRLNRLARFYTPLVLGRRVVYIFTILVLYRGSGLFVLISLFILQIIYCITMIVMRPFDQKSNNIIEIINEAYNVVYIGLLVILRTESMWEGGMTQVFLTLIVTNMLATMLVQIGKSHIWVFN